MNDNPLSLDNQLCFPLYACARRVVSLYKPYLDEVGLTYTQYLVMLVMWEERAISVKRLGEKLYLDSGTLTPLLKKMQVQGLVERNRDKADERSVLVTITEKGASLREKALEIPEKLLRCVPLEKDDAVTLYTLLHGLLKKL